MALTGLPGGADDAAKRLYPSKPVSNAASVDGTAGGTKLSATEQPVAGGVVVKNTHATFTLYVGASGLTTSTGYPIAAGASEFIPCDDVSELYGLSSSTAIDVRWIGATPL
jgi:hypothetical protein